jgi:periplasmic glucans biosynthesis protein
MRPLFDVCSFFACFSTLLGVTSLRLHAADFDATAVTNYASLQAEVAKLATQPYVAKSKPLAPYFANLKYDDHRQIRFNPAKAHFGNLDGTYRLEFFHPGWTATKTVGMYDLGLSKTTPIGYDPKLFDWGQLKVPEGTQYPEGFAGFRVLAPDTMLGRRFEFLVFMGASYFRSVTTELGYGLSARGVSVNTIGGEPEEFPDFTDFWFVTPQKGEDYFTVIALLNGPSIVGAYEFKSMPGKTTEMFVKGTLYLRKPVKSLGISPFSSMYWFGENSHPKPYDFRPEVHDSDGIQIEIKGGPSIWRPLDNSKDLRLSLFDASNLKGFGLSERDREYKNFEDLEAAYHRRPAVWVEPVTGFEKGNITLVEIPTGEETWDNVVAYYQPEKMPTASEPLQFSYRLQWLEEHIPGTLAKVIATRRGFVMKSDEHLYVLDFNKGALEASKPLDWLPEIDVQIPTGSAKVVDQRVMYNPETHGWRAFFRLAIPAKTNLLEMTCELKDKKTVISERWMYQWRR